MSIFRVLKAYLNININKQRSEKNVATLSMVLSMTISCLRNAGMKRTSFSMRSKRNVLNTDTPLEDVARTSLEFNLATTSNMLIATMIPSNIL